MRTLTPKEKYELIVICQGKTWVQFCRELGLNSGRVGDELNAGIASAKTMNKIETAIGIPVETGFELIHDNLSIETKINVAIKLKGVRKQWLAAQLGMAPASFTQRIKTGRFTLEEWKEIGEVLGFEADYVFKDGDFQF